MVKGNDAVIVMGGGLAGLAAAHALVRAGRQAVVLEAQPAVGGLARTVVRGPYRFDLGGHRIFTTNERVLALIRDLVGDELLTVPRKSRIRLRGRYFDYPLTPANAMLGMGPAMTWRILRDYAAEKVRGRIGPRPAASLEDWVVAHFGRTLFEIYFKVYSEKVWGIPAHRISAEWVAQRIQGLSLTTAIKAAFLRAAGRGIPTLADEFLYPAGGIGRLAERLAESLAGPGAARSPVVTGARVERLFHSGDRIESAAVRCRGEAFVVPGAHFVSTIPLPALVGMLHPRPPAEVLAAASRLRYRDLVVVAVMLARERVTDLTWLYLPEPDVPFGRIHEPTNWSRRMAPPGRTLLVAEHFCFQGDDTWRLDDGRLIARTARHLERLGLIRGDEVVDGAVVRVPRAYPLFEVGYEEHCATIRRFLAGFENLHLAGRTGSFRYFNVDHALQAGMDAARAVLEAGDSDALRGTA